ncbi:MAG: CBS domain-containing protein [Desulfobacterales bacterium]|jgi:signal-transduction protein with cAMP-binding, CBS, and nucleotidyltransferase domain
MNIREFMTVKVVAVEAQASVYDAVERMVDRRIRSLIVRFGDNPQNDGVITARDIVYRVFAQGKDPLSTQVGEIASRPVVSVSPDATVHEVAEMMETRHVARVFVVDGQSTLGVVSLMDILAAGLIERARRDDVAR